MENLKSFFCVMDIVVSVAFLACALLLSLGVIFEIYAVNHEIKEDGFMDFLIDNHYEIFKLSVALAVLNALFSFFAILIL